MDAAILDGIARGRQRLSEHLSAKYARAAQVAALAAIDPVLDALELEQLQEVGEDRRHGLLLVEAIQARDQARSVPTFAAHGHDVGVELIDERGDGELGTVIAPLLQADAQVLAHPFDGETEVEFAFVHRLPAVFHLPRLRSALRDRLDDRRDVEAGLAGEVQRLGETLHGARDRDLIDHIRELARARGTLQADRLRVRTDHRLRRRERLSLAADHDGELAVLGAGLPARYRRVEAVNAALQAGRSDLARDVGRCRRVVAKDGSRAHRRDDTVRAERDLAHIWIVTDADEHDLGTLRGRGGCWSRLAAVLL